MKVSSSTLNLSLVGCDLTSPIILAAGTCGYLDEMAVALDLSKIGGVTTKSITPLARDGNSPMRVLDVKGGMVNAVGLANMGVERFVASKRDAIDALPTNVLGSIAGFCVDDYVTVASAFEAIEGLPIVEMNVSCPNCDNGRLASSSPESLREHVAEVRAVLKTTKLFVKLPPSTDALVALSAAAIDAGADGLTLTNTLEVMSIDVQTRKSRLGRPRKGMSGPGIHPLAVRLINDVSRQVARDAGIPIIGLGGVLDWRDAAEMILAGASAVGVGTGLFVDPSCPRRINKGLARWVRAQGCSSISELVGAFEE